MQARILMGLAALYCGVFAGNVSAQPRGKSQEGIQSQAPGSRRTLLTLKLRDRLLKDVLALRQRWPIGHASGLFSRTNVRP